MSLQVLGMDAIYAAIRKLTDESSMSSDLAMVGKLLQDLEANTTLCTKVAANIWMLCIKMIRDVESGCRKCCIASFNAAV